MADLRQGRTNQGNENKNHAKHTHRKGMVANPSSRISRCRNKQNMKTTKTKRTKKKAQPKEENSGFKSPADQIEFEIVANSPTLRAKLMNGLAIGLGMSYDAPSSALRLLIDIESLSNKEELTMEGRENRDAAIAALESFLAARDTIESEMRAHGFDMHFNRL